MKALESEIGHVLHVKHTFRDCRSQLRRRRDGRKSGTVEGHPASPGTRPSSRNTSGIRRRRFPAPRWLSPASRTTKRSTTSGRSFRNTTRTARPNSALFERLFRLHRETDGDFGRAVEHLNQVIAEQASELALRSRLGDQFDPAIAGPAFGTDDIGFLHGQTIITPCP
jgi:hypothetical protein